MLPWWVHGAKEDSTLVVGVEDGFWRGSRVEGKGNGTKLKRP